MTGSEEIRKIADAYGGSAPDALAELISSGIGIALVFILIEINIRTAAEINQIPPPPEMFFEQGGIVATEHHGRAR